MPSAVSLLSGNGMSPFFFTAPSQFLNNIMCWNSIIFHPLPSLLFGCTIPTWLLLSHSFIAIHYLLYLQSLNVSPPAQSSFWAVISQSPQDLPKHQVLLQSQVPLISCCLTGGKSIISHLSTTSPDTLWVTRMYLPHHGQYRHPRLEACREFMAPCKASNKSLLAQLQILLDIQKAIFVLKLWCDLSLEV